MLRVSCRLGPELLLYICVMELGTMLRNGSTSMFYNRQTENSFLPQCTCIPALLLVNKCYFKFDKILNPQRCRSFLLLTASRHHAVNTAKPLQFCGPGGKCHEPRQVNGEQVAIIHSIAQFCFAGD